MKNFLGYIIKKNVTDTIAYQVGQFIYDKYIASDDKSVTVIEKKQFDEEKQEKEKFLFDLALLSAAYQIDNTISADEQKQFHDFIQRQAAYDLTGIKSEIEKILHKPIRLSDLKKRRALLKLDSEDIEKFQVTLEKGFLDTNEEHQELEDLFKFRVLQVIHDVPNIAVFTTSVEKNYAPDLVTSISIPEIRNQFPETNKNELVKAKFFVEHPVNNSALIPLDFALSEGFALSKDTELISIARLAGAKSVEIIDISTDSEKQSNDVGGSVEVKTEPIGAKADVGQHIKQILTIEESKKIKFEYEGNRPSRFRNWLGFDKRSILKQSKWIKHDALLVEFVNSCFGFNLVTSFNMDFEYSEIGSLMKATSLAGKCKTITKLQGSLSIDTKSTAEKLIKRKVRYIVKFK